MNRMVRNIFLSSPSDLGEERQAVQRAVELVNKSVGRRCGVQLDLLSSRDALPGFARPQEIINRDVDRCQLFIGMLWKKWGENTGKYSSGFEEEFVRARERSIGSGTPDIWLFFKKVEESRLEDPGEQLSRVLEFREVAKKELFFKEFNNSQELERLLLEFLITYVDNCSARFLESQDELPVSTADTAKVDRDEHNTGYPQQLKELLEAAGRLVSGDSDDLSFQECARLFLFAFSKFSDVHASETLGIHEMNIAYRYRQSWDLCADEIRLLCRSVIGDQYVLRPGWFWIKEIDDEKVELLLAFLVGDPLAEVRQGAISLLVNAEHKASTEFLEKTLASKDIEVVIKAIELVVASESKENIDLLQGLIAGPNARIRDASIEGRLYLLALDDPNTAFSELLQYGNKMSEKLRSVLERSPDLQRDLLIRALSEGEASVREFSARYMRKKELMSKDICDRISMDPSYRVRQEGFMALIELGERVSLEEIPSNLPIDVEHLVKLKLLTKYRPEELVEMIDWYLPNGPYAYQVVATQHFDIISHRIRTDLNKSFESLRLESKKRLQGEYGQEFTQALEMSQDVHEYIRSLYISAALSGLAVNGCPEDIRFARQYIGRTKHGIGNMGAIKIMERFGDVSDAESLINNIPKTASSKELGLRAKVALSLSSGTDGTFRTLMESSNPTFVRTALKATVPVAEDQRVQLALDLLQNESEEMRLIGLDFVMGHCDSRRLLELLDEYCSHPSYYYNVVAWLDRCLFAPEPYMKSFRKQLSELGVEKSDEDTDLIDELLATLHSPPA